MNHKDVVVALDRPELLNTDWRKRRHGSDHGDALPVQLKVGKIECVVPDDIDSISSTGGREGEFLWTIDKFCEKQRIAQGGTNTEIFSDPFYSRRRGYKLRLVLCPNGSGSGKNTHLSLFFQVMRGEYDSTLAWPMRDKVTVTLVSRDMSIAPVTRHYRHDELPEKMRFTFDQPKTDVNTSCGNPKFVTLESLLASNGLYRNDQILLRCIVDSDC